jgi:hypothetical protein
VLLNRQDTQEFSCTGGRILHNGLSSMLGDCLKGITLSRLFLRITACQKALVKEILHGEMTHEASFQRGLLCGSALACRGIFGPFLLCHTDFGPMVCRSIANHPKKEQEERDAMVHGVRGQWLGQRASGLRESGC